MKELIDFFKKRGFVLNKENTNDNHFYMDKQSNIHLDAQGDVKQLTIRLIGKKQVEEHLVFGTSEDDLKKIDNQIKIWES